MVNGLSLAVESEQHAGESAQVIDDIIHSLKQLNGEMSQVVVAIEEIPYTTEEIARKREGIHVHRNPQLEAT